MGKEAIKAAIVRASALFKKDQPIKVDYSCGTLDAQQSADGGVILLVTGTIRVGVEGEADTTIQNYVQNFYLAPQATDAKSGNLNF